MQARDMQVWCRGEPVLEPFAEVCLQGVVRRSAASLGSEPAWQEHFPLPYSPVSAGAVTSSLLSEVSNCSHLKCGCTCSRQDIFHGFLEAVLDPLWIWEKL